MLISKKMTRKEIIDRVVGGTIGAEEETRREEETTETDMIEEIILEVKEVGIMSKDTIPEGVVSIEMTQET